MKILVDEIPNSPKECAFSYRNCEYGWICRINCRVCKDVEMCQELIVAEVCKNECYNRK